MSRPRNLFSLSSLRTCLVSTFTSGDGHSRTDISSKVFRLVLNDHLGRVVEHRPVEETLDALDDAALAHLGHFRERGQPDDLDNAVSLLNKVVQRTDGDDPERFRPLLLLAMSYSMRFEHLDQVSDLNASISTLEEVLPLCKDDPMRAGTLNNYGHMLRTRFKRLGDPVDIDKSVSALEEAVHLTPDDPRTDKPNMLLNLGGSLRLRCERLGNLADLDRSISVLEDALQRVPDHQTLLVRVLDTLGASLQARFEHSGNLSDIDRSIALLERAILIIPDEHPDRASCLNDLGGSLLSRFQRLGNDADIMTSVSLLEQSMSLAPEEPGKASNLGFALSHRFRRFGDIADIQRSISLLEEAVRRMPEGTPGKLAFQSNLGRSLMDRFELLRKTEDIDSAIAIFEDVDRFIPKEGLRGHIHTGDLSTCPGMRFERLRDPADLKKAVSVLEDVLARIPKDRVHVPQMITYLGGLLMRCFELNGDVASIDRAVLMHEEALQLLPDDHADRHIVLSNLCNALSRRCETSDDLADIHKAISRYEDVLQSFPEGHPNRSRFLVDFGTSLRHRFERQGDEVDIIKSISVLEESDKLTPEEHPLKAYRRCALGLALVSYFAMSRDSSLLSSARSHFSFAARSTHSSSAVRFDASRGWLSTAQLLGEDALEAYELAVNLLPQLAWMGLSLQNRHRMLEPAADFIRDAAAYAIRLGRTQTAIEWLEQGRSIVWSQLLQLRTPLDELRERSPALAERLMQVSKELEMVSTRDPLFRPGTSNLEVMSPEQQARRHHALAKEHDDLLVEVRSLPGFERFLLPKTFSQLVAASHSGPVVILDASERRCDALIITANADEPIHVPLPGITYSEAMLLQGMLRDLLESGRQVALEPEPDRAARLKSKRLDANGTFKQILSTLWKKVVFPVLESLGYLTLGELRRVFWCPIGPFAFLPIHAAGLYDVDEPGVKVSDFVISSYTPTLGVLVLAPIDQIAPTSLRILSVLQPNSDGQVPLPGARREIAQLQNAIDALSSPYVSLLQSTGTVDDVLARMAQAHWVHFACHGIQDLSAPLDSGLLLVSGRRLRLSDIIQLSERQTLGGGLAFLSACQTATGDRALSEEAVHLAAGMLMAGYRSVIATMWSIGDSDAPEVAQCVYEKLFGLGKGAGDKEQAGKVLPDARKAAQALHVAVARLRAQGAPFASWVPFVHFGL